MSISNGSSFGPGQFYRSPWQQPDPINNQQFFKWTITLTPQILVREFIVWYVKYAALHGASFGSLRFSISSNLRKGQPKNFVFGLKMAIIWKQLAEFWRDQQSKSTKRCTVRSCILYIPNTKISDEYSSTWFRELFGTIPKWTGLFRVFFKLLY